MAQFFDALSDKLIEFIQEQKVYFVATAPFEGRINLNPKGLDSFRVLGPKTFAFLNLTGSGNETSAHLFENGRITVMFCSFDQKPLILKLYGQGRAVYPRHPEWEELYSQFTPHLAARQIVLVQLDSAQTSCGYGVPFFEYQGDREKLTQWGLKKGPEVLAEYRAQNNQTSIDGKPTGLFEDF
ncbi:MAG: pyridoxamine 5'-phosphate oxidase family protein [bacterium]|nr:pyridoxamine 5'-phosphate oxidase family protein [bacterium]